MSETALTPEDRWEFDCRGYLALRDFLDSESVEELIAIAGRYEQPHYSQTGNLLNAEPAFRKIVFHPRVDAISQQFFGDYRIKGSVLVINPTKEKRKGGIEWPGWHRDADHGTHSYYATASPSPLFQLRFFVALSDVETAEHGGLALYPGSHRTQLEFPFSRKEMIRRADVPAMRKGDCLLMHHATLHTALPNESDRTRVNVQALTSPVWIRSGEAENIASEVLEALPEEHRKRLAAKPW